jgi:hypothetical protein
MFLVVIFTLKIESLVISGQMQVAWRPFASYFLAKVCNAILLTISTELWTFIDNLELDITDSMKNDYDLAIEKLEIYEDPEHISKTYFSFLTSNISFKIRLI